jgi:hypothetical protein
LIIFATLAASAFADEPAPDFTRDVTPVFRKYCVGCHNGKELEGQLSLESYAAAMKGGETGEVIAPGKSGESRMILLLTGKDEPQMPPEGEKAPTPDEIALITRWIDAGAKAPEGGDRPPLVTPKIDLTAPERRPINAAAFSPDGQIIALARYGEVELLSAADESQIAILTGHTGNVNAVCFSPDGALLAAAAGEPGLFGEVRVWSLADRKPLHTIHGHQDSIYALDISPDGRLLATGSYDHNVKLWELDTGKELRTLENHNGAVFGVAFHPGGHILATASADRTVKLWDVETGRRLDTLEQSTQELYTLAFFPDGKRLAAAGADNRIRVWAISASGGEGTNPILVSQFGHEKAILRLALARDGRTLVSTGEDRLVKVWDGQSMLLRETFEPQPDWTSGLTISPDGSRVFAGRLDGSFAFYPVTAGLSAPQPAAPMLDEDMEGDMFAGAEQLPQTNEIEPNDDHEQATPLTLPGLAKGRIFDEAAQNGSDVDLYRIQAKGGQTWIVETKAARSGSPLDTKIEILDAVGNPVPRLLLRATRDSWITFRGIDSTSLDCRLVNWEEMQLNQYLYMNGEVTKLYRAPQGPDSGFQFYPGAGKRHTYFDTTAHAHPVDEPSYIVAPYPRGTVLPNNGLPTFTVYYENDDEHRQALGKDSYLTFTAPQDGEYLVRVSDVRGYSGESFNYDLLVSRPRPDFKVSIGGANPTIGAASGKRFTVTAERLDGFSGEIRIDVEGLPPGFTTTTPITIQEGHLEARGVVNALPDAPAPTEENWAKTKVTATAMIGGKEVKREVGSLGTIKLAEKPKLVVRLTTTPQPGAAGEAAASGDEVVIRPGTTVTCELSIERNGFNDRVQFDVDNLPHGVIVDNIGLNGVLIPEGMTTRTLYLTAADWVPATRRQFFAVAKAEGDQASSPLWLRVEPAPGQ